MMPAEDFDDDPNCECAQCRKRGQSAGIAGVCFLLLLVLIGLALTRPAVCDAFGDSVPAYCVD